MQNAERSPLLRLPAELRNKIWEYAYSGSVVFVDLTRSISRSKMPRTLIFRSCQQEHDLASSVTCRHRACATPFSVPTVSKQFWFEAAAAFLASSTFDFEDAAVFHDFALSGRSYISRIHRISLRDLSGFGWFGQKWHLALNSSLVALFEGLQGIHLGLAMTAHEAGTFQRTFGTAYWMTGSLSKICRSFQQHKLDAKHTTVSVVRHTSYWPPGTVLDSSRIEGIIKNRLLEHIPSRRSTRGRDSGA
jgi:hypothetical protein